MPEPSLTLTASLRPAALDARRGVVRRAAAKGVPLAADADPARLADALEGFSAADCAALVREAALAAMRESLDTTEVTAAHVTAARGRVRPSLDPAQVAAYAAQTTLG